MVKSTNAATAIATVIMLHSAEMVYCLSCYRCTVRPPVDPRKPVLLCSNFNYSSVFQVDCPYSSFCMKKTSSIALNDKNVQITLRDCAPQKEMDTVEKDGRMQWVPKIVEAYQEGCIWKDNRQSDKVNNAVTCYCRQNMCNGQAKKDSPMSADIMGIIVAYNVIKYVRSFD